MVSDHDALTKDNLLRRMAIGWDELQAYLGTLSEAQLTEPTDAAGWTAKDHVIHLAIWEDSAYALLGGQSQRAGMDIDPDTWKQGDDAINAVIQNIYQHMPVDKVFQTLRRNHERLVEKVTAMTEEELLSPYRLYDTSTNEERPVIWWVIGNTMMHYGDHLPWIKAIVE